MYLTDREPFGYQDFEDNIEVVTSGHETLAALAAIHFAALAKAPGLHDPAELDWIIADFQPEPVPDWAFDMTILVPPRSKVYIPSVRVVEEFIFSESRRVEHEG